jgi:hypothetical protein
MGGPLVSRAHATALATATATRATVLCLVVAGVGLIACRSDAVEPTAVPIAGLQFVAIPDSVTAGNAFTVSVEFVGDSGERVRTARDHVELSLIGTGNIVGPGTVAASRGLATFDGLSLTKAGSGLRFRAVAGSHQAVSGQFRVYPASAELANSSRTPTPASLPDGDPLLTTFTFRDRFDNPIALAPVSLAATPAGAGFSPDTGTTDSAGVLIRTFRARNVSGSATLLATVAGTTLAFAPAITICPITTISIPGSVNGTLNATSCVARGLPMGLFRFDAATAIGAQFALTTAFTSVLEVRSDPVTDNVLVGNCGAGCIQAPAQGPPYEWLLPAGTYHVRVGALTGTGTFTLMSAVVSANSGCKARHLVVGGTYTGQRLSAEDCDFGDGTRYDEYIIFSTAPCAFTVRTTQFSPYIWIYDRNIGFQGGVGGDPPGVDLHIGLSGCRVLGSPLRVWVNSEFGELGGTYTFIVQIFNPPEPGTPTYAASTHELRTAPAYGARTAIELKTALRAARKR